MNIERISGLLLRYVFLYSRSVFRLLDVTFWPILDLLMWGFVTMYMMRLQNGVPTFVSFLIGAIIFWNILYRAQQAVSVSFLDDVWAQNLLNVFVAPVRISEFIIATYMVGLMQAIAVTLMLSLMAFVFYAFNVTILKWTLIPFFVNLLILGWTLGMMTTALIIRWGHSAEALAWAVPYIIQPVSAVFYPVSVLPTWLQPVAMMMPSTYAFEGMRKVLRGEVVTVQEMVIPFLLNILYMILAAFLFRRMYEVAREKGLLARLASE
jgi:ABC-2 type transport system permease protein